MTWHVFTYKTDPKVSFNEWLANLLNGLKAEQFVLLDKNTIIAFYHESKNDEYDDNGIQL